jgi:regulator of protease activity HflC (stomatin/prohibitin superfamily)
MRPETKLIIYVVVTIVAVAVGLLLLPFTIVGAGERAVVTQFGVVQRVLEPGFHFLKPIVESSHKFDVQVAKEQVDASSASADLQDVTTSVALNYSVNPDSVADLYTRIGDNYKIKVIDPAIQEAVKASTAKYTAEQLITKRAEVKDLIQKNVGDALSVYDILVSGVSITDFKFSASFNASIEAKVKAEQDALTAKNKLEQIKYEAEQTVATAQATAEAIRIQATAINSQGGADYVQLQAIKAWDGHLPTQMIPGGTVPFLNLKN